MVNQLKSRIVQLESRMSASQKITPGMVYITPMETLEEAEAKYERRHGYKRPEDAPVIQIICVDASKQAKVG